MFVVGRCSTTLGCLTVHATERADGDLHPLDVAPTTLWERQTQLTAQPWTMLDQVHGAQMVRVLPGGAWTPTSGRGDIAVGRGLDRPVAVWAADCAPVVLIGADGSVAAIHAGWRGIAAGVIDVAVDALEASDVEILVAVVGPCIRRCCYAFGARDLAAVVTGVGVAPAALEATTSAGERALDMPTAVVAALDRHGIPSQVEGSCTGCDDRFFSHRTRGEAERHALVVTGAP